MRLKRLFARTKFGVRTWVVIVAALSLAGVVSAAVIPNLFPFLDHAGLVSTFSTTGPIRENGAFFQSLGTNGRTCATCHQVSNAMGLSLQNIQARYFLTGGRDPLFAAFDGANCPNSNVRGPQAHSVLLSHGLIRVALTLPASAKFQIRAVVDPYGCAITTDPLTGLQTVSVYRRPLPAANLKFLSTVMWDGRESTTNALNDEASFQHNLVLDLMQQAIDATTGHAQATVPPTLAQQQDIVNFELGLFSAQIADSHAGPLNVDGANGGALNLANTAPDYYPGVNDVLGGDPHAVPFNTDSFSLFSAWQNATPRHEHGPFARQVAEARADIAAGEILFNTRPITISGVRGLNDNAAVATALGVSLPIESFQGTCTTCHDTPSVGNHSLPLPLDLGLVHSASEETDPAISDALSQLTLAKVPVYEIDGCPDPFSGSSQPVKIYTTDPGKALISGACADVNRVKGPILRGLAARAPYFHNGGARNLNEVLDFYNQRFQMNLTATEKRQLVAFLNSL